MGKESEKQYIYKQYIYPWGPKELDMTEQLTDNKMCCAVLSCSVVSDSLLSPWTVATRLLFPWGFSRQEYWSGLPFSFSRRSSRPQGSNPGLPHCKQILYCLSCQGSPISVEELVKADEKKKREMMEWLLEQALGKQTRSGLEVAEAEQEG